MRKGSSIATGFGNESDGPGFFDPLFGCQNETVEAGLFFNPIEFDGIKLGIVEVLPDAEKFNGVSITHPV
jgi:hypothetical protein